MMLNAAQAAEILGISARLVYAQSAPAGPIPCYRIGTRISFDESEIQEYKKSCQCIETKKRVATSLNSTVTLTASGSGLENAFQRLGIKPRLTPSTGSYGTVQEPCNFPQKFPDPVILVDNYLRGETLIEAYWKSVAMPGQGIFIGEPLAAPFRPNPAPN